MRVRFVALTIAVCAACLFTMPQPPAPAEPQQAGAIDFDALRTQATAAVEALQQSGQRQAALQAAVEF